MAEMNLDYYKGSDSYSDGDVEERILECVRSGEDPEKAIDRARETESADDAFAFLYHLSPVRENILSWYPFRSGGSCLEIGAGEGAITGVLCRKLGSVTSVDLSRRRCEINYARHMQADNLKIMAGNLNDMKFPGQFDYVVLNGVLEYAASFTKGEHPFRSFLKNCAGFLKKDGVLLVAIENRLGLKYFAGAPEDHTGNYMEGLKGYRMGSGVGTFSKAEWQELADECGLLISRFYYPNPDYKFPAEVFTDSTLTASSYSRCSWNFNERRIELFSEQEMAETLEREGVLSSFMNSFLVEMRQKQAQGPEKTVIYAKMNADRARRFRIQTMICRSEDGEMEVVKSPLCPEAEDHLLRMKDHEQAYLPGQFDLDGTSYKVTCLPGQKRGDSLVYPYLEGESLGHLAGSAADSRDKERIIRMTDALWNLILQGQTPGESEKMGAFRTVFGSRLPEQAGALVMPANIDLIFDNLIFDGDEIRIIDGEWIFDFPVPAGFILFRAVNELYSCHPLLEMTLPEGDLLARYQISDRDIQSFRTWAGFFEKRYVQANRLAAYAREVKKGDLKDLNTFEDTVRLTSTLYMDRGSGYSEKDAVRCSISLKDGRYDAEFEIPGPGTVKALRFDPLEGCPSVCALEADGLKLKSINSSADRKKKCSGKTITVSEFLTKDPSYRVVTGRSVPASIRIHGKVELKSEDWALERARGLLSRYQRIFRI